MKNSLKQKQICLTSIGPSRMRAHEHCACVCKLGIILLLPSSFFLLSFFLLLSFHILFSYDFEFLQAFLSNKTKKDLASQKWEGGPPFIPQIVISGWTAGGVHAPWESEDPDPLWVNLSLHAQIHIYR